MASAIRDRRRFARQERSLSMILLDREKIEVIDTLPRLQNVSRAGMKFMTTAALNSGETFGFNIELPQHAVISGIARARWVERNREAVVPSYVCGAEIESMSWTHAWKWRRILKSRPGVIWLNLVDVLIVAGCWWFMYQPSRNSSGQVAALFILLIGIALIFLLRAVH